MLKELEIKKLSPVEKFFALFNCNFNYCYFDIQPINYFYHLIMQTIKSFFAPAPYGTPWTTSQIEQIQINQRAGKKMPEPEKTKLDRKRDARSFAIQVLKIHFGNSAFLNRDASRVLDGIYLSKTSILISYMVTNNIIAKVGKPIHQDGYFYRFVNAT